MLNISDKLPVAEANLIKDDFYTSSSSHPANLLVVEANLISDDCYTASRYTASCYTAISNFKVTSLKVSKFTTGAPPPFPTFCLAKFRSLTVCLLQHNQIQSGSC